MSEDKNDLLEKTENEVTAWSIAGLTLSFVALAGFIACVFFAENWLTHICIYCCNCCLGYCKCCLVVVGTK